jgi:Flp pilus assembly protein TadD
LIRGSLALRANDPTSAADWLQKAAALGSRHASLFNVLGVARAKLKQFEEAARWAIVEEKHYKNASCGGESI